MITQTNLENLRYPVGRFIAPKSYSENDIKNWIETISDFPLLLRKEVEHLTDSKLDTPYREGGWTARQVVHHVADSHINSYVRFKLALTEDNPVIKPYFEDRWAELPEAKNAPVAISLNLIDALHKRWTLMLRNMSPTDFNRTYFHPEHQKSQPLAQILALYEWHCRHHLAHIGSIKAHN
jgi:hypothetical protein